MRLFDLFLLCHWFLFSPHSNLERLRPQHSRALSWLDITRPRLAQVLGKGQLPQQPVVVRAKFVSKLAERKIKEVGGAVELVA